MESASSRIGSKFSSRVISDSKIFIALLRVEIVFEAYMSRLLTLASPPNTRSPPVFGQAKGASVTAAGATVAGAAAGVAAGCGAGAAGAGAGAATGCGVAVGCIAGGAGAGAAG